MARKFLSTFAAFLISFFAVKAQVKHVIVIGVDGLASYGIRKANTPVMDSMMQHGAWTLLALSEHPTLSSPNWASILMGVRPASHQIRSNGWQRKDIADKIYCGGNPGETYPTIFKVLRSQDSLADIGIFHHWQEFINLVEPAVFSEASHYSHEDSVTNAALNYLARKKPALLFMHLDLVDKAGHHYGLKSKEYKKAVEKTDSLTGVVMQNLQMSGLADSTIVMIVSDHGFIRKGHGGISRKEKRIPVIIVGPNIAKASRIRSEVRNSDIAPTIGYLFSLQAPPCWTGKVIKEAFR